MTLILYSTDASGGKIIIIIKKPNQVVVVELTLNSLYSFTLGVFTTFCAVSL